MQLPKLILFDMIGTLLLYKEESQPYWHKFGELLEAEGIMFVAEFNGKYASWQDRRGLHGTREVTLRERLINVIPSLSVHLSN
jgi:hypothetical protein